MLKRPAIKLGIVVACSIVLAVRVVDAWSAFYDVKKQDEQRLGVHFDVSFQDIQDGGPMVAVGVVAPKKVQDWPIQAFYLLVKTRKGNQLYTSLTQPSTGRIIERNGKQYIEPALAANSVDFRISKGILRDTFVIVQYSPSEGSTVSYSVALSSYYSK